MNWSLKNSFTTFSVDENGKVEALKNNKTGHNYAGGEQLLRIIYEYRQELDTEFDLSAINPKISVEDEMLLINYDIKEDRLSFGLQIEAKLEDEKILFDIKIANNSSKAIIREVQFGIINCRYNNGQSFYWSHQIGEKYFDIREEVKKHHSYYKAQDNKAIEMISSYPDWNSMNYMLFADNSQGLYMGSHDETLQNTAHLVRKRLDEIDVLFCKYPFIKSGESIVIEGFVLAPYSGTWHEGADIYRKWAEASWYFPPKVTESIKDMKGWQRMILRHQYGRVLFPYDDLERAYDDAISAGIDTLFIFGWWTHGMDAGYPDYSYDESQGGFKNLKKNIEKVQTKGGKIILYFNGKLIDISSEFYKTTGKDISIKSVSGFEIRDFYPFSGDGTSIRIFGNKCFVSACTTCKEWMAMLKSYVDIAVKLEVDGVFFDQLGFSVNRCWDKSHGHPVPYLSNNYDKIMVLKELREYVKSKNPKMSFGIELETDICVPFIDYTHSTIFMGNVPSEDKNARMLSTSFFPEIYKYTFPEAIISDRAIRDDLDIERRVNLCLLRGMVSDVEIYRCRATIAETPHYQEYLGKVNKLRDRYSDLLLEGTYRDTSGFTNSNPEVEARMFVNDKKAAVVLSQSHLDRAEIEIRVPGYRFQEASGTGKNDVRGDGENAEVYLEKNSLVVLVFIMHWTP